MGDRHSRAAVLVCVLLSVVFASAAHAADPGQSGGITGFLHDSVNTAARRVVIADGYNNALGAATEILGRRRSMDPQTVQGLFQANFDATQPVVPESLLHFLQGQGIDLEANLDTLNKWKVTVPQAYLEMIRSPRVVDPITGENIADTPPTDQDRSRGLPEAPPEASPQAPDQFQSALPASNSTEETRGSPREPPRTAPSGASLSTPQRSAPSRAFNAFGGQRQRIRGAVQDQLEVLTTTLSPQSIHQERTSQTPPILASEFVRPDRRGAGRGIASATSLKPVSNRSVLPLQTDVPKPAPEASKSPEKAPGASQSLVLANTVNKLSSPLGTSPSSKKGASSGTAPSVSKPTGGTPFAIAKFFSVSPPSSTAPPVTFDLPDNSLDGVVGYDDEGYGPEPAGSATYVSSASTGAPPLSPEVAVIAGLALLSLWAVLSPTAPAAPTAPRTPSPQRAAVAFGNPRAGREFQRLANGSLLEIKGRAELQEAKSPSVFPYYTALGAAWGATGSFFGYLLRLVGIRRKERRDGR